VAAYERDSPVTESIIARSDEEQKKKGDDPLSFGVVCIPFLPVTSILFVNRINRTWSIPWSHSRARDTARDGVARPDRKIDKNYSSIIDRGILAFTNKPRRVDKGGNVIIDCRYKIFDPRYLNN